MNSQGSLAIAIRSIVKEVAAYLPEQNVIDAYELLEHDEWGEALLLICTQLHEYNVTIRRGIYDRIALLGHQMQLPAKEWKILREHVEST